MILAKLSGLQKIFAQLQAGQYLPVKKFFVKVSAVCWRDCQQEKPQKCWARKRKFNLEFIYQSGNRLKMEAKVLQQHTAELLHLEVLLTCVGVFPVLCAATFERENILFLPYLAKIQWEFQFRSEILLDFIVKSGPVLSYSVFFPDPLFK